MPGVVPPTGTVCDEDGVAGQTDGSVTNPTSFFADHALVLHDEWLYDPSYGSAPVAWPSTEALKRKWEVENLAGFMTFDCIPGANSMKPDDPALVELFWVTTP